MTCSSEYSSSFVEDGLARWWKGVETPIREEVTAEFAERLRQAALLGRFRLRLRIEREVNRRLKGVASPSPEALF